MQLCHPSPKTPKEMLNQTSSRIKAFRLQLSLKAAWNSRQWKNQMAFFKDEKHLKRGWVPPNQAQEGKKREDLYIKIRKMPRAKSSRKAKSSQKATNWRKASCKGRLFPLSSWKSKDSCVLLTSPLHPGTSIRDSGSRDSAESQANWVVRIPSPIWMFWATDQPSLLSWTKPREKNF